MKYFKLILILTTLLFFLVPGTTFAKEIATPKLSNLQDLIKKWVTIQKEISQENQQKITQALNQLSKRQKEAIYLKFYTEMDYQQIAEIMQLNYQSVRNLVHASLKKLRQILAMGIILLLSLCRF